MRQAMLVAAAAAILGLVALVPSASAAPTLTFTATCDDPPHVLEIGGSGFPPNQEILLLGDTTATITFSFVGDTDASGDLAPGGFVSFGSPLGLVRVRAYESHDGDFVADPDEPLLATAFIDNPCGAPTLTRGSCTDDGWRSLGFKNQGQCVAFVARTPSP